MHVGDIIIVVFSSYGCTESLLSLPATCTLARKQLVIILFG